VIDWYHVEYPFSDKSRKCGNSQIIALAISSDVTMISVLIPESIR